MFKPTGIGKAFYSRDGRALEGEVTRIFHDGPIDVLVIGMGASQTEINAQAEFILHAYDNARHDIERQAECIRLRAVVAVLGTALRRIASDVDADASQMMAIAGTALQKAGTA